MSLDLTKQDYLCYIDESGDEGFKFGQGSSDWFILAAVVTRKDEDTEVVSIIPKIKKKLDIDLKKHLHWKKLRHLEKEFYTTEIVKQKCKVVIVAVFKPALIERENFQRRYRLYFYTVRYLLERVTWFVRDDLKTTQFKSAAIKFFFSNRSGMSYEELKDYLRLLRTKSLQGQDVRILWEYFDPDSVLSFPPGRLKGLVIADAAAGAFYNALETSKPQRQKTDYAVLLRPIVYKYKNIYWGYGFKIVPREAQVLVEGDKRWEWCKIYR